MKPSGAAAVKAETTKYVLTLWNIQTSQYAVRTAFFAAFYVLLLLVTLVRFDRP